MPADFCGGLIYDQAQFLQSYDDRLLGHVRKPAGFLNRPGNKRPVAHAGFDKNRRAISTLHTREINKDIDIHPHCDAFGHSVIIFNLCCCLYIYIIGH